MKFEEKVEVSNKTEWESAGVIEIDAYQKGHDGGPTVFLEKIESKNSSWIEELSPVEAADLGRALLKAAEFAISEGE